MDKIITDNISQKTTLDNIVAKIGLAESYLYETNGYTKDVEKGVALYKEIIDEVEPTIFIGPNDVISTNDSPLIYKDCHIDTYIGLMIINVANYIKDINGPQAAIDYLNNTESKWKIDKNGEEYLPYPQIILGLATLYWAGAYVEKDYAKAKKMFSSINNVINDKKYEDYQLSMFFYDLISDDYDQDERGEISPFTVDDESQLSSFELYFLALSLGNNIYTLSNYDLSTEYLEKAYEAGYEFDEYETDNPWEAINFKELAHVYFDFEKHDKYLPKDISNKVVKCYELGIKYGDTDCMFLLGLLYGMEDNDPENIFNIGKNPDKSKHYLELAASNGNVNALEILEEPEREKTKKSESPKNSEREIVKLIIAATIVLAIIVCRFILIK